jgi:hypothetical protein
MRRRWKSRSNRSSSTHIGSPEVARTGRTRCRSLGPGGSSPPRRAARSAYVNGPSGRGANTDSPATCMCLAGGLQVQEARVEAREALRRHGPMLGSAPMRRRPAVCGALASRASSRSPSGPGLRARGGRDVAYVRANDNVFDPPILRVRPGETVGVDDGRDRAAHRHGGRRLVGLRHPGSGARRSARVRSIRRLRLHCSLHGARASAWRDGPRRDEAVVAGSRPASDPGGSRCRRSTRDVRVPRDYPTIQQAVDHARPGGMVLVSPGVYEESVTVTTPYLRSAAPPEPDDHRWRVRTRERDPGLRRGRRRDREPHLTGQPVERDLVERRPRVLGSLRDRI